MSEPKILANLIHEWERGRDALTRAEHDVEDLFHPRRYHQTSTPATPATEAPVKIADIGNDIRNSVQEGAGWLSKTLEEHVPALLAEVEKIQASPIAQVLEGLVLPPAVEQQFANMLKELGNALPAAPAAPAVPAVPAAPVATDGAPAAADAPAQPAAPVAG